MITVRKVSEKDGKSVYQAYDDKILGEVVARGNTILSEQTAPLDRRGLYRDFMLRSVVFLLSQQYDEVAVAFKDEYFYTLGFEESADGMRQKSELIVFPSACGGHEKK